MTDARFEDGGERPLRLIARDRADLRVIAALVQDAVLTGTDLRWQPRARRFALLLSRFRWEDRVPGQAATRPPERVQSLLTIEDVTRAMHQGLDRRDRDTVLSLLTLDWQPDPASDSARDSEPDKGAESPTPAGPGRLVLVFAGDGAVALGVECLEVSLADVTRPYAAPTGRVPDHGHDT